MNETTKAAIAAHAIAEYPRECVGLVALVQGQETYTPCVNWAATPTEQFVLAAEDYARAEDAGEIVAIVHSHPGGRAHPSAADKAMCEASGIARWVIASVGVQANGSIDVDEWCEFGPTGFIAPLVGRPFVHGVHDCYSIVRDWYRLERDVVLPDFERRDEWWADGKSSLYLDNYRAAGFVEVGPGAALEIGDVLLMQIRSQNDVPNHAGIYIGDGQFLHHMHGQLSRRAVWGGMWLQSLRMVLRYEGEHDE
ncbi:proteasome lid subunit RPN8/RPN11 [Paraburkholderia bannensis]|uniref:Proteasome lid subunit RPN8/RPN11 n=1 Tax=Paraburkholderia bannensis TaxID=765414 RepID=A0A7W9U192_9BURK|nr:MULTISPECIES: C40 family peptidase [Paraburkholderia]MBB3260008.1 proteasome lid subunit RPN8/RPN11 [Paraburkholderia sp. WP4_3_2]MBB6105214.1 proteasome lid subunit RPN8/RPN11 [Paraburkholderia bannensis]